MNSKTEDDKEDIDLIKNALRILLRMESFNLAQLSNSQHFSPEQRIQVIELLKSVNEILTKMENKKDGNKIISSENYANSKTS